MKQPQGKNEKTKKFYFGMICKTFRLNFQIFHIHQCLQKV